jgi:hypothetical protein
MDVLLDTAGALHYLSVTAVLRPGR